MKIIWLLLCLVCFTGLASGWYSDYQYKQEIKIKSTTTNMTGYQARIDLNSTRVGANFNWSANGADIRFTNTSDSLISHWIENWTAGSSKATVWVKIPTLTLNVNKTIYMYYGKAGVSSASNGYSTFPFFDDFPGSSFNSSLWTETDVPAILSVSGGNFVANRTATYPSTYTSKIISKRNFTLPYQVELKNNRISDRSGTGGYSKEFSTHYTDSNNYVNVPAGTYNSTHFPFVARVRRLGTNHDGSTRYVTRNAWHRFSVDTNTSTKGNQGHSVTVGASNSKTDNATFTTNKSLQLSFSTGTASTSGYNYENRMDFIFVRQPYSYVQPTEYFGSEIELCTPNIINESVWSYDESYDQVSYTGADWCTAGDCTPADPTGAYDGDWATYAYWSNSGGAGKIYLNYTKLADSTTANWLVKDSGTTTNLTLPSSCFSQSKLQLRIHNEFSPNNVTWSCYNGTAWQGLRTYQSTNRVYEEATWWSVPNWTVWTNISECYINDTYEQERNITQYDENSCGAANVTFHEYQWLVCDFCTPILTNTSWSAWANISSCYINDTIEQSRNRTQYDSEFCGEVSNVTFYEYQWEACSYCTENWTNTSWSAWADISSCYVNSTKQQRRSLTQYDANYCGGANQTFYDYQWVACVYTPTISENDNASTGVIPTIMLSAVIIFVIIIISMIGMLILTHYLFKK